MDGHYYCVGDPKGVNTENCCCMEGGIIILWGHKGRLIHGVLLLSEGM